MERSLTDEEINDMQVPAASYMIWLEMLCSFDWVLTITTIGLQWNVREAVKSKLEVELR
jgi:hypothetical protein